MDLGRLLVQTATYWPPASGGANLFGAQPFGAPVAMDCRWEQKAELFMDKNGKEVVSRAKVFFAAPNQPELGGYLFEGDATGEADPRTVVGAYEIRSVGRIPDLRNLQALVTVYI